MQFFREIVPGKRFRLRHRESNQVLCGNSPAGHVVFGELDGIRIIRRGDHKDSGREIGFGGVCKFSGPRHRGTERKNGSQMLFHTFPESPLR